MIGLCIALGVGANECFQMMLGRRGLDVMKLLHIVIISMCISFAGSIANLASVRVKLLNLGHVQWQILRMKQLLLLKKRLLIYKKNI